MADLTQFKKTGTLDLIESGLFKQQHRSYLGMSQLGNPCDRYLWYSFRWFYAEYLTKRQIRLFARGHREEEVVIAELEKIGIKCHSTQLEVEHAFGHCKGHNDGLCDNVPEAPKTTHLLEIKTINDAGYKDLSKKGVRLSKPIYYSQVQVYMRKLGISRALFVAVNKNDDSIYVERIRIDKDYADDMLKRAEYIILCDCPPRKVYSSTWFLCKMCSAKQVCHFGQVPERSCRSCKWSAPTNTGTWHCNIHLVDLDFSDQIKGCDEYTLMDLENV